MHAIAGCGLKALLNLISVLTDAIQTLSTTVDGVRENDILKSSNAKLLSPFSAYNFSSTQTDDVDHDRWRSHSVECRRGRSMHVKVRTVSQHC